MQTDPTRPFRSLIARTAIAITAVIATATSASAQQRQAPQCDTNNAGLKLPAGFCAVLFADSLPTPRQLEIAPNGDVIVGLNGVRGREGVAARPGGFAVLRDTNGDGRSDRMAKFGDFRATTVKLRGNHLFTETSTTILRYRWNPATMSATGPDTIVSGLPGDRSHAAKTFVIRGNELLVNHGSPSNACQEQDRIAGSKGLDPCPELETRAGIWRFDLNKTGQTLSSGSRYSTGIRNAVAMAIHPGTNDLYVVQHGRDNLSSNWPALFTNEKNAETPAEEMFRVTRGSDFGWPYCYYDAELKAKVLAPEYGGDGRKAGLCASKAGNVGAFPGHWAPNSLLFYTGTSLPARYRNGAFIVFHGSWNRAPLAQQGFKVVFQPMTRGRADGDFEVFVDGFNQNGQPTELGGRPMAIAQGPRGELYLSDDSRGRIWKITYVGRSSGN